MARQTSIDKITSNTGVINKINIASFWDYFDPYFFVILMFGVFLTAAIQSGSVIGIVLTLVFGAIGVVNLIYLDAVVKVEIKNRDMFVMDFEHAFSLHFKALNLPGPGFKRLRMKRESGLISWGRIVHVIQHDNYLYFNVVSLDGHDMLSPFHGLYNYYKCRKVAKYFSLLQS